MIEIIETNYTKDGHEKIIIELMNHYATDIITPLSDDVKANLVRELEKREGIHTVIAFADNVPAGLAISIEGFSTFSCKPLLNIHDLFVSPGFRGKGISKMILKKLEEIALQLDCCKLTLEVLENNEVGINLYKSFGFSAYELDPSQGRALFLEKKL
ncbi:MAG: GNAT family N-acetyltransferase [Desulfobacteraceae bacterium]|nr:GNAT family N-acetyltransferase [Desulfobacteraceae bacterium]